MEVLAKGLTTVKNNNGFTVAFLHYSADEHKSKEWADKVKKSYPSQDIWNQEMELDFTKASGKRVYMEFRSDYHVSPLRPIPYKDIWRGWDFGYHHPACVWGQYDPISDQLNILAELLGSEKVINEFARDVIGLSQKLFPGYNFLDAGDPAVRARTDKSERTSADILRSLGIRIQSRQCLVKEGINLVRNLLIKQVDDRIRFKIDPQCKLLIDGFLGGYCRNDEDEPEKDGYYEHLFDGLRYMVTVFYNVRTFAVYQPRHVFARARPTAIAGVGY